MNVIKSKTQPEVFVKKYPLLLIFIFATNFLFAQKNDSTYKYWMTFGAWVNEEVNFNFNYSFSINDNFYKVGYFYRGGFCNSTCLGENGYLIHSFDISIGKRLLSEWFQAAFFVGPSYVCGDKRISGGNRIRYGTVGLQGDIQLLFRLANEIGIGIGLYGNLNFEKNYSGVNINITLGNGK